MLRFYVPLAVMVVLITVTHSIIDAGLARLPRPEEVLAGYAVAKSIALVLENPMFMVRQTTVSLVRDRRSYQMVRVGVLGLALLFFSLIACVAYIPSLAHVFLNQVMGLDGPAYAQARSAILIMPLLPLATGWRNFQQGLAILKRGNDLLPFATVARLIYLVAFVFGVAPALGMQGAIVGSAAFVGGLGIEMIVMSLGLKIVLGRSKSAFLALRKKAKSGAAKPQGRTRMEWSDLGHFFLPLAATSLIMTGTLPLVNGFIARGAAPEVALAAYAVALSLGQTLANPINMLHQVALTYVNEDDPGSSARVLRFFVVVTLSFTALIALVAFTPIGAWILRTAIGLPSGIATVAQACLGFFIVIALTSAAREYVWGILMQRRQTRSIGAAKAFTTVVMALVLAVGLKIAPESMAVVAAAGLASGSLVEALYLMWYTRRSRTDRMSSPHTPVNA